MQNPPSPSSPPQPSVSEMETIFQQSVNEEPSSSQWDWSDLLDFNLDDPISIHFNDNDNDLHPIEQTHPSSSHNSDKIRKRDPRLTCSNFLAGLVPCACPELDALQEEEEKGKKRPRTAGSATARCQVPGCEVDITELKGYHRRHRVCLRCAHATSVLLDGHPKRYCQQCGKFHILSDFDEGKRSCRRKLERHNNRRRRKSTDSKEAPEKEPQQVLLIEDIACDDGARKDSTCLNSQAGERETVLEPQEHISIQCSAPGSENIQNDSGLSFAASGETQIDEGKEKYTRSPSYCDNKSALSSMCPTGRISFKLYDWNPAEFPRRLRHQIFQWLASMPVELEGYIRPGCTILTVFIAMPNFMWIKLFEDPVVYIHDLVAPGSMLSGRGTFLVYLNNMIFRVMEDTNGTSVIKVKVKGKPPKLHYVHPTCFEAGKPMEFVACGSNLLQPKFRFLVSFAGKYLKYDVCVQTPCNKTEEATASNFNHQLLKIFVPHTEQSLFGPAFIEVENESGLSNYIPILIGDTEICSEMKIMQQKFDTSLCSKGSQFAATSSLCEVSVLRQKEISEFILHVAWLLKEPSSENTQHFPSSSKLQRLNCLLDFLIENESTAILERVLYHMKIVIDNNLVTGIADTSLYQRNINHANNILHKKLQKKVNLVLLISSESEEDFCNQSSENDPLSGIPATNQDMGVTERNKLDALFGLTSSSVPLLNGDVVMSVNFNKEREWPRKSCSPLFTSTVLTSRPLVFAIVAAATACFGICAVVFHPQKVGEFATTIRRCLFNNP